MRRGWMRAGAFVALLAALSTAGCRDVLAVAGLSNLSGYWVGSYDADFDFFLDLDDDLYGLYGRGGLVRGEHVADSYVDGERDGSEIRIYTDDGYDDYLIFEGTITGENRIVGLAYMGPIPEPVVLHR